MSTSPHRAARRNWLLLAGAFLAGVIIMAGVGALLLNIQERKVEALEFPLKVVPLDPNELDPQVWGRNFTREFNTFMKSQDDTIRTKYGGSVPFSKLEKDPNLVRLYAGYAFSVDYNKARGHYYALIDQKKTKRQDFVAQPGACANCHSAEAPQLAQQMGWENFNHTPYKQLQDQLHTGTSCADCHDPQTMDLRISRPAFKNAMAARGIDLSKATRQEMRTYVCAQCHVEYYFAGDNKVLTFPWTKGTEIEQIEQYYTDINFKDWTHQETGAPMLKMQHPEFELYSTGPHAAAGVACADCHMAYVRDGAVKVSDHWLRSPLTNISQACQPCHRESEADLKSRVEKIQDRTYSTIQRTETAMVAAIDAIQAAQKAGATDTDLAKARDFYRKASMRWDFVSSENSTGFHSPQESERILADAIDFARQAQLEAQRLGARSVQ
ncbi:MAG: ammonia-forming cytochrome c nitrite reductase subunit c552 [Anaerolineae bacterium]